MIAGPNNSTYSDTILYPWKLLTASRCIPWLLVHVIECLTIVILNIIIIIVFGKQRRLQRKSTYMIIHLAIVDLLVGAVNGPLWINWSEGSYCDIWEYNRPDVNWVFILERLIGFQVHQVSLFNLACISLERVHATFRPFKHRFIKKRVYGVIMIVTWLVPLVVNSIISELDNCSYSYVNCELIYLSYYFALLFVMFFCYISIYLKVRSSCRLQNHGAACLRERKLTRTLFVVTLGSLITFLPMMVFWGFTHFNPRLLYMFFGQSRFHIEMSVITFVFTSSLINPIVYAIRMPEIRAGILQIIFRKAPNPRNPIDIPLENL